MKKLKAHKGTDATKINTPLNITSEQPLLGQDGHDQKNHGILESNSTVTNGPTSKPPWVVVASDGEVRNKTIKEKLRSKLLKTNPPYDK